MKKTFIIALCCMALSFAACKPDNPTPAGPDDSVDHTEKYVGSYIGSYVFNITSMNHQPGTASLEVDDIGMDITQGDADNTVVATVSIDNQTQHATGTTTNDKVTFSPLHFVVNEMHQSQSPYICNVEELLLEGSKADADTLNITGTFAGNGSYTISGTTFDVEEISGYVTGKLVKQ